MVDKHREASTHVIWSWGVPRARSAGNGGPVSHPGVAAFGVQRLERGRFGPQRAPHGELASDGDVLEDVDGADDDGSGGCCRRGRPSIALLLAVGVAVIALSAATCVTSKVESLAPNLRAKRALGRLRLR